MSAHGNQAAATAYRVYWNGGGGGPVDYSAPVASTDALSVVLGPLAAPGDHLFGVRAYDPLADLEESNTDVTVRILIDEAGVDRSGLPRAPLAVTLAPAPGGGLRASWAYPTSGPGGTPEAFRVALGEGPGPGAEVAVVPHVAGCIAYTAGAPGPFARGTYWAEVTAVNAQGAGPPSARAEAVLGLSGEPLPMDPVAVQVT